MAETVQMIALSPTMEKGVIQKWLVMEGDTISSGDIICEVETDKTAMEYEAVNEGLLLKILVHEGQEASVGTPIAIVGEAGEDITELIKEVSKESTVASSVSQPSKKDARAPEQLESKARKDDIPVSGKIKASPLARTLAKQYSINLAAVHGSGPGGRIIKRDIEQAHEHTPADTASLQTFTPVAAEVDEKDKSIPLTEKRKVIAQRVSQSLYTAPHYYLKINVVVDNLINARKEFNSKHTDTPLTFNTFLIKLVAIALRNHPAINTSWAGDTLIQHNSINIGLAVAQKDGLITPVIKDCDSKGIKQINDELLILIEKARNGQLLPEEYSGSTFTITNLGSYDIDEFSAIINPPNAAILAIGRASKVPVVDGNEKIAIQTIMKLTLSCDHRLIDGAVGAQFLKDLKEEIEYPVLTLL